MNTLAKRLRAVLLQRCPRCLEGKVYHGLTAMNEHCPACGHRFEREPGYFLGSLYASYFLSIPLLLGLFALLWWLLPTWPAEVVVLLTAVPYLVFMPFVVRYARVIWMYIGLPPDAAPKSG
jgi:uncharacterized protein (DUF983 family)